MVTAKKTAEFQRIVRSHFRRHGRSLPWRRTRNPYRILVSEVMLQQTQVERVIPFYMRFLKRFPTTESLASAELHEVLTLWSGLGYNRRAKYLRDAARIVCDRYAGKIPRTPQELEQLPGIGHYSARAVAVFAFGAREAFIETNIRSAVIHHFFLPSARVRDRDVMHCVFRSMPSRQVREWYWALMDYGTFLKREGLVRNAQSTHYVRQKPFKGSRRELRGKVLRLLRAQPRSAAFFSRSLSASVADVRTALDSLEKEHLVTRRGRTYSVAR